MKTWSAEVTDWMTHEDEMYQGLALDAVNEYYLEKKTSDDLIERLDELREMAETDYTDQVERGKNEGIV